jgi:hypothetical protein
MAEAAKQAIGADSFNVAHCETAGMMPFIPVMRTVNNQGDGTLFGRNDFLYEQDSDTYICPGDKRLLYGLHRVELRSNR